MEKLNYAVSRLFFSRVITHAFVNQIKSHIEEQIELESHLMFDNEGKAKFGPNKQYVIDSRESRFGAIYLLQFLQYFFNEQSNFTIHDVGGGVGGFFDELFAQKPADIDFKATLSTLTDFSKTADIQYPKGVSVRKVAAELPPDEFYQAFDIVVSINGPLQWSYYPQIVLENMIKMTKPGGLLEVSNKNNYFHPDFSPLVLQDHPKVGEFIPLVSFQDKINLDSSTSFSYLIAQIKKDV